MVCACRRGRHFLALCRDAGVASVFIGLESTDDGALIEMQKQVNRDRKNSAVDARGALIARYKTDVDAWHQIGAWVDCGYHSFFSLLAIGVDFYLISARRPFLYTGVASFASLAIGVLVLFASFASGSHARMLAGLLLAVAGGLGATISLAGLFAQRLYEMAQGRAFYELRDDAEIEAPPR